MPSLNDWIELLRPQLEQITGGCPEKLSAAFDGLRNGVEHLGDDIRDPRAYLLASARNAIRYSLRRAKAQAERLTPLLDCMEIADPRQDPEAAFLERESLEGLMSALDSLPAEEREILRLRFWEGLEVNEIGELLGIERTTVWRREQRALQALRQALGV